MKHYNFFCLTFALVIFSCESKDSKNNLPKTQFKQTIEKYNPISVCDCNDDGINTLKKILKIRKSFPTLELYQKDLKSIDSVKLLREEWTLIRDNCMKKFAAKLFMPSDCNQPDKIGSLRDKLNKLNIKTS